MISLVPAYGRRYPSAAAAEKDWLDGLDFKIYGGPYTSIRDRDHLMNEFNTIRIWWDLKEGKSFTVK
jgi:hypothetical protein